MFQYSSFLSRDINRKCRNLVTKLLTFVELILDRFEGLIHQILDDGFDILEIISNFVDELSLRGCHCS